MKPGGFRVVVDATRCIAAGQCVAHAPLVFDQSESDGTVVLLDPRPGMESRAAVEKAVLLCPAQAIAIEEIG